MLKDWILGLNDYLDDIVHDAMIKDAKKLNSKHCGVLTEKMIIARM